MQLKQVVIAVMGFAATTVFAANDTANVLKTEMDKLSYSIGVDLGQNMKKQGIEINPAPMVKGMQDGLATDAKLLLTEKEMKDVLLNFQKELMAKRTAQFDKSSAENKSKGDAFLAANKTQKGVVVLPSGLQYKIITAGTGPKPGSNDNVTVDYTGKLINGTVFDSSEKAGKPATFKLSQVIPGWSEALKLMPVGSTWEIYIPSELAYGKRNVGGLIGPNETLIFNVHLISSKP